MIFRSVFWPTVTTVISLIVLCWLGYWQIERSVWKSKILHRMEMSIRSGPVETSGAEFAKLTEKRKCGFRQVVVRGHFLTGITRVSQPQGNGFFDRLFVPFQLSDGPLVLVDLGAVERGAEPPEKTIESEAKLHAAIRCPETGNMFTSKADLAQGRWFTTDIAAMAEFMKLDGAAISTAYLQALPEANSPYLRRDPEEFMASIPNNHFSYALTWFSFGVILLIIYIIYFIIHLRAEPRGPKE